MTEGEATPKALDIPDAVHLPTDGLTEVVNEVDETNIGHHVMEDPEAEARDTHVVQTLHLDHDDHQYPSVKAVRANRPVDVAETPPETTEDTDNSAAVMMEDDETRQVKAITTEAEAATGTVEIEREAEVEVVDMPGAGTVHKDRQEAATAPAPPPRARNDAGLQPRNRHPHLTATKAKAKAKAKAKVKDHHPFALTMPEENVLAEAHVGTATTSTPKRRETKSSANSKKDNGDVKQRQLQL